MNRHGEGDESALHRRASDPRWPRVMRWCLVRAQRSVDRGACRPGYGAAKSTVRDADVVQETEGNTVGGVMREPSGDPARSENQGMYVSLHAREPGDPTSCPPGVMSGWVVQGTPVAVSLG